MKGEILKLLKETDGYVSGQELCRRFGVSRTAVWKVINQLKEEGYEIEAVRNRGYALKGAGDVLSEAELLSCLKTEWAGGRTVYFDATDSTNIQARRLAEAHAPHGTLVVSDRQDGGKGRRGRSWASPSGVGIWMSLILRPEIAPSSASMLTLAAALAVREGIQEETGLSPLIKWPNDLVLNGKKICGILTEMSTELMEIQYVITGIGINVNQREFPSEIRDTATSLSLEAGRCFRRSSLIAAILKAFEKDYAAFLKTGDLSLLLEEYNACLVNRGKEVCILDPLGEYRAVAEGIDESGSLLVTLPDGTRREIISGEVSVRGIYGYV